MKIVEEPFGGVKLIEMDRFEDERGWFSELWNEERYRAAGLDVRFVQTNISSSARGVLRGLHYQAAPHEQGKLVSVLDGAVFDVVVDIRADSPSFGQWYGCELSHVNWKQLWVPEGFAHGFLVTSDVAVVHYNCTRAFTAGADRVLAWDDAEIGIDWPQRPRTLSRKDSGAPGLRDLARSDGGSSPLSSPPPAHDV